MSKSENSTLKIIFPGLNQIYKTFNHFLDYEMLYRNFVEKLAEVTHKSFHQTIITTSNYIHHDKNHDHKNFLSFHNSHNLSNIQLEEQIYKEFKDLITCHNNCESYKAEEFEKLIIATINKIIRNNNNNHNNETQKENHNNKENNDLIEIKSATLTTPNLYDDPQLLFFIKDVNILFKLVVYRRIL